MARTPFKVEVLTPEGEVFSDEVEMVSTRTTVGSIGVLAHHQPLLGLLEPTELRLYKSESDVERYAQGEGYIQVGPEGVLVLVEEAVAPDQLDTSDLQDRLRRAEEAAERAEDGSEEQRRAQRDRKRWEAFLRIAGGQLAVPDQTSVDHGEAAACRRRQGMRSALARSRLRSCRP
jgi:F-type H+-transporting ATPase subunit epsilon